MITDQEYAHRAQAWLQVFERQLREGTTTEPFGGRTQIPIDGEDAAQLVDLCQFVINTVEERQRRV